MATYKGKRRIRWKSLISVFLVLIVLIGAVAGVSTIADSKTRTISPVGTFICGSIDTTTGEYVKSNKSIVSKEMFSCAGLTVTPEFDNECKYQIFWYNMDKVPMGSTSVLKGEFFDALPECAKYCRIVITPEKVAKQDTINYFDIIKIAKKFKIEVDKNQSVLPVDYYKVAQGKTAPSEHEPSILDGYELYEDYACWVASEEKSFSADVVYSPGSIAVKLDCTNVASYKIFLKENSCANVGWGIYDIDGNRVGFGCYDYNVRPLSEYIIDIPVLTGDNASNAKYIVFCLHECEIPPVINKFMPR